jgi:hypothetical protein
MSRYNFSFWQPQPEILIFNEAGFRDTVTQITEPAPAQQCGSFDNPSNKENSDYYDYSGNYYQNTSFSEWYDENNDFYYYSIYDLPDYCDTSGGGSIITPLPYSASNTKFTLTSSSAPGDFGSYVTYSFKYQPFLKVDKTIENSLGSSFQVYQILVDGYYVAKSGQYYKYTFFNTYFVTQEYDAITDKYIIYPTTPFSIVSDTFESILFVVKYSTNAGDIIKHQTVNCYDITDKYAFPLGLFNDGAVHTFYIPLNNDELKSINTFSSKLYDVSYDNISGLVSAKISAIAINPITIGIDYDTSKVKNDAVSLYIPYGNTTARCGTVNVAYGGYVGFAEYGITVPNGTGMLEFAYANYGLPDRFAITINSQVKYDTLTYRNHGNRAYIPITSNVGSAGLRVYTNDPGTTWIASLGCLMDYSIYTPGLTFDFNNEFSKNDILVLSNDGISYTKAKENSDYSFTSIISPTVSRYTAISTIIVLLSNERIIGRVVPRYVYTDPYTSLPVHHLQINLSYPNKTIIGSDPLNPSVGDIRITKLGLNESFINYEINMSNTSLTKYFPYCLLPGITGNAPATMMGSVEYVKDSQTYDQMLIIRDPCESSINLLDPLGYTYFPSGGQNYRYIDNVAYGSYVRTLPQTKPTSGYGFYFEDSAVNDTITMPYAQPFYGNYVGDKLFLTRITTDNQPDASIAKFSVNVSDGVNYYSSSINNLISTTMGYFVEVCTRYDGNTTQTMNISLSGCTKEAFYLAQTVLSVVYDLPATQTYPSENYNNYIILKKDVSYGPHAYVRATLNSDYTVGGGFITATTDITLSTVVNINPLI